MTTQEFQTELKALDPRLEIVASPNRPGLSNIKIDGRDICPLPSEDIREEPDPEYVYVFPNGMKGRHKSRSEALKQVLEVLELLKTEEGNELFFAKDE